MITILIVLGLFILAIGPARPWIFSNLRFFIPAVCGAILAYLWMGNALAASIRPEPLAPQLKLLSAAIGFVAVGKAVKEWLDQTFGPRE